MGLNVGSPYIPPDNVLLSVNSSTGAMELKPGTRGDMLYAGASGVWSKLAKGTDGQYLKIGANDPAWSQPPGEGWTLLETITPAAASTVTTAALTAYDEYKVMINVYGNQAGDMQLLLRFNGDTGANYNHLQWNGATPSAVAGATSIPILGTRQLRKTFDEIVISGKSAPVASGLLTLSNRSGGYPGSIFCICGEWAGGNATQITTMTFLTSASTITGKIQVYGRSYP